MVSPTTSFAYDLLLGKHEPTLGAIVGPCRNSWGRQLDPSNGAISNGNNACRKEGLLHDRRCQCFVSGLARGLAIALGHFLSQDDCIICNTPPCPNIVNLHIVLDDLSYPHLGPCLAKAMARFHGPRGHQQLHVLHFMSPLNVFSSLLEAILQLLWMARNQLCKQLCFLGLNQIENCEHFSARVILKVHSRASRACGYL